MRSFSLFVTLFALSFSPLKALEVHQLTTPKGIKVWFAPDKTVPVISMTYSFENAGSAHEPQGKEGVAMITAAMMTEGAGVLDANALAENEHVLKALFVAAVCNKGRLVSFVDHGLM